MQSGRHHAGQRSLGAVHGRFQPFHNGHLFYLRAALAQREHVIVGITNPYPPDHAVDEHTDPARHLTENNPFSYFERVDMIAETCRALGLMERVRIVPFDVTGPRQAWANVIPLEATQFVVPHEPWDEEKAKRFREHGYEVQLLETVPDRLSGTKVRGLLRSGDLSWRSLVPEGTATVLRRLNYERRLHQGANTR